VLDLDSGKGKVLSRTDYEDLEGARWGGWLTSHLATLLPVKRPATGCAGRWVGPRTSLDEFKNLALQRELNPGPFRLRYPGLGP
jgi:hypothetical protein